MNKPQEYINVEADIALAKLLEAEFGPNLIKEGSRSFYKNKYFKLTRLSWYGDITIFPVGPLKKLFESLYYKTEYSSSLKFYKITNIEDSAIEDSRACSAEDALEFLKPSLLSFIHLINKVVQRYDE